MNSDKIEDILRHIVVAMFFFFAVVAGLGVVFYILTVLILFVGKVLGLALDMAVSTVTAIF